MTSLIDAMSITTRRSRAESTILADVDNTKLGHLEYEAHALTLYRLEPLTSWLGSVFQSLHRQSA